jgi:hypothetical protein
MWVHGIQVKVALCTSKYFVNYELTYADPIGFVSFQLFGVFCKRTDPRMHTITCILD